MKTIIKLMCIAAALALVSCQGTWLMYDTSQKDRLYFEVLPTPEIVSFALITDETIDYKTTVKMMGMPVDYDRTFHIKYIPAEDGEVYNNGADNIPVLTAREGIDFSMEEELVIPAGAVETDVNITLQKTDEMSDNYIKLTFRIVEDEEFLPMDPDSTDLRAIASPQFSLLVNAGDPSCPYWWGYETSTDVMLGWQKTVGTFYPDKFRKMLDYYRAIENKNPSLYEQLLELYGENIDKEGLSLGFWQSENSAMWATYVLIPLYNYYKDYYEQHPDDPKKENFADRGTSGEYWANPLSMLR